VVIVPGIHQVDNALGCNVYLLLGQEITLIDAGLPGNSLVIDRYLRHIGRSLDEIGTIVLTHYHPDHAGAVPELYRRCGCRIAIHAIEAPYLEGRLPPAALRTWGAVGAALSLAHQLLPVDPVPVSLPVQDGTVFEHPAGVCAIHTPGHTPGSMCLYLPERRLVFTGDALVRNLRGLDLAGFPVTVDQSLGHRSLSRLAPYPIDSICFGHGRPMTQDGAAAISTFLQGNLKPDQPQR
jgi:glyoxylase-like metal-dependent hydrolase (beta-lactamase superfamily II)